MDRWLRGSGEDLHEHVRSDLVNAPCMHVVEMDEVCRAAAAAVEQKERDGSLGGLSRDMVLAGNLFTNGTFSNAYVAALRESRPNKAPTLAGYSKWLLNAVAALPPHQGVVWVCLRGPSAISMAQQRIADGMKLGWNVWSAASSAREVPKKEVSELGEQEDGLLIRIDAKKAVRKIGVLAVSHLAQEFVIIPNASFAVIKPYHLAPDRVGEVHLKEIAGHFVF